MNKKLILVLIALCFLMESTGADCLHQKIYANRSTLRPMAVTVAGNSRSISTPSTPIKNSNASKGDYSFNPHYGWVAIQLAGGEGRRVKPAYNIPKPLIPIAGKPMMRYFHDIADKIGLRTIIAVPEGDDRIEHSILETGNEIVSSKLGRFNAIMATHKNLKYFTGNIIIIPADIIITDSDILTSMMKDHIINSKWHNIFTFSTRIVSQPHSFDRIVRRKDGKIDNIVSQSAIDLLREGDIKLKLSDGTELKADELEAIKEVWGGIEITNSFVYKVVVNAWKWLWPFKGSVHKKPKAKKQSLWKIRDRGRIWRFLLRRGLARAYCLTKEDSLLDLNTPEHVANAERIIPEDKDYLQKNREETEIIIASYHRLRYELFHNCISDQPLLVRFFLLEIFTRLTNAQKEEILYEFGIDLSKDEDFNRIERIRYYSEVREYEQIKSFLERTNRTKILDEFGEGAEFKDKEKAGEFIDFFKAKESLYAEFKEWIEVRPYVRFFEIAGIEKAGQFLSTQKDWIPERYRKAFEVFQNNAIPAETEEVISVIESHFGNKLSEIFSELQEDDPGIFLEGVPYLKRLKAGTVATTFFARFRNGREAVLKIITPSKRKKVLEGINILRSVAHELEEKKEGFSRAKKQTILISPTKFFEVFRKAVIRELNMNIEAVQQERLNQGYPRGFSKIKIYHQLTGKNVLIMGFIPGIKATRLKDRLSRNIVANKIVPCIILEALADGVHHSNPQPGNIFYYRANNTTKLFDAGQIGELPDDLKKELIRLCVRIIQYDTEIRISQQKLGFLSVRILRFLNDGVSKAWANQLANTKIWVNKSTISFLGYILSKRWVARLIRYALFNYLCIKEFFQIRFSKEPDIRARVLQHLKERGQSKQREKDKKKEHTFFHTEDFDTPLKELCDKESVGEIIEFLGEKGEKTDEYNDENRSLLQKYVGFIVKNPPGWGEETQPYLMVDRIVYAARASGLIIKTPYSHIVEDIFSFFKEYAIVKDGKQTTTTKLQAIALKAEIATILRFQRKGDSIFAKLNRILIAGERFGYPAVTTAAGMLVKSIVEAEGVQRQLREPPGPDEAGVDNISSNGQSRNEQRNFSQQAEQIAEDLTKDQEQDINKSSSAGQTVQFGLNEGAIHIISKDIVLKQAQLKRTMFVAIDGDKHVFKSSFATAVERELGKALRVKLIHLDSYYEPGLFMEGQLVLKEGWDWSKLAKDLISLRESERYDIIVLEGTEVFNLSTETLINLDDFDLKINIKADRVTREWVFKKEGYDKEEAEIRAAAGVLKYKDITPKYDFIVDTSFEFWKGLRPVVLDIFIQKLKNLPLVRGNLSLLPDGIVLRHPSEQIDVAEWAIGRDVEKLDIPVKDVIEYKPLFPLITEVKLDTSGPIISSQLDKLFDVSRQYAKGGGYYALACDNRIFAIIRFNEVKMTCDIICDSEDIAAGGALDYWLKRRDQIIRVNPIEGTRKLFAFDVIKEAASHIVGISLFLEKPLEEKNSVNPKQGRSKSLSASTSIAGAKDDFAPVDMPRPTPKKAGLTYTAQTTIATAA